MKTMSTQDLISTGETKSAKANLIDGMYPAAIIGVVGVINKGTDQKTNKAYEYEAARFVFQLKDEDGKIQHIQGPAMSPSLSEKATLRKWMASWLKVNTAKEIVEKMETAGIISNKEFNWDGFLGKTPQVTIELIPSKTDSSKIYANIKGVTPSKKGQVHEIVPATIPEFFVKDSIYSKFVDGIKVWSKEKTDTIFADVPEDTDSSDLPFN